MTHRGIIMILLVLAQVVVIEFSAGQRWPSAAW